MRLRFWLKWIGVNLLFYFFQPAAVAALPVIGAFATSLIVNATLFVLPAIGWSSVLPVRTRRLGMRLFCSVGFSTVVFIACLAVVRLLGLSPTRAIVWNAIWLTTNVGFAFAAFVAPAAPVRRSLVPREIMLAGPLFAICYGFYYWGATRVVPRQLDHDLEVQATGFGLINRFEPLLLTDRGGVYYFAHPPLLHLFVGGSFLLHGEIDKLRFYDDVSLRALDRRRGHAVAPPDGPVSLFGREGMFRIIADEGAYYMLAPEGGGPELRVPADRVDSSRIIAHYLENPYLIETRTPNLFFAAVTVALLAIWAGRLSHRWWLGLLVALAYASSAEVFVRSSYGGYFAIGGFATVSVLLAAERWRRAGLPTLAGAFAALVDHKLVLLPAAYGIQTAFLWLRRWGTSRIPLLLRPTIVKEILHPVVVGFLLGTAIFWLYGAAIGPWDFYHDHIRQHLINRVAHVNDLGYDGYPAPFALWREFAAHTAYIFLPVALALMCADLLRSRQSSSRQRTERGLWALYTLLTASTFTLIDWRMTKHLMPILLPLHLALTPDRNAPTWRVAIPVAALLLVLSYNAWEVWGLAQDFSGFRVTPDW